MSPYWRLYIIKQTFRWWSGRVGLMYWRLHHGNIRLLLLDIVRLLSVHFVGAAKNRHVERFSTMGGGGGGGRVGSARRYSVRRMETLHVAHFFQPPWSSPTNNQLLWELVPCPFARHEAREQGQHPRRDASDPSQGRPADYYISRIWTRARLAMRSQVNAELL